MYLKTLKITKGDGTKIREISFHNGLNLIIDETPNTTGKETGNNVGKTTVLKLVDFCLGANPRGIYTDTENKKHEYKEVKDFLTQKEILISLILKDDLSIKNSKEVLIERNFLNRKNKIQKIDGSNKTDEEFEESLTTLLFTGHFGKKPTFRQMIAHNIRYEDLSINNTLKNLDRYTSDAEYETLYLFLLGCNFEQGDEKNHLRQQIDTEEKFKRRLESTQTKSAYETSLSLLNTEIKALENKRESFNLNVDFEAQLENLNELKYQINVVSSDIGRLKLRQDLILEAQKDTQDSLSTIDLQQLRLIYEQATSLVSGIQKSFEELQEFHNSMVHSKIQFIIKDLPVIEKSLSDNQRHLKTLLTKEAELGAIITQSDSFEAIEKVVKDLTTKYQKKGEFENILKQITEVESKLAELHKKLSEIDDVLFSDKFSQVIKEQVNKFSEKFSRVSFELYGEKYGLKSDVKTKLNGSKVYEFTPFNTNNFSSGKKQGEITCFDIAYTLFADEENIPCMHFLLTDKKELMHDNQLVKIANFVNKSGIQFVTSILKDKLPIELRKNEFAIIKLSPDDKLFKIENQ